MYKMTSSKLLSKFRGSVVGGVIGDCVGALYEMNNIVDRADVLKTVQYLDDGRVEAKQGKKNKSYYTYTDDTAMARSVAGSLSQNGGFVAKDMAKRFTEEFNKEPYIGYGGNVVTVFKLLQDTDFKDVYEPARKQFDGQGSFGNGGSMRISPAALFSYNKDASYVEKLSRQITEITHSHYQAIQGAILECLAVHLALHTDNQTKLDTDRFLDDLISHLSRIEDEDLAVIKKLPSSPSKHSPKRESERREKPYCYKLNKIKEYLNHETELSVKELVQVLGNDISALGSVPAAIYSFLRCTKPFTDELKDRNGFENTIIYAICLGGDTDTIATMAGSIAGAYYGIEAIPSVWQTSCEGVSDAIKHADKLYKCNNIPQ